MTPPDARAATPAPGGSQSRAGVDTSTASDVEALEALRQPWTELLRASDCGSPFLTWEWMATWWRVYGRGRLHVVLVRDSDGGLIGIAPMQIVVRRVFWLARWPVATFIGYGGDVTSEHLDFIARRGFESVVADAVFDDLQRDTLIRQIDLQPFRADSPVLARLHARCSATGGIVKRVSVSWCPFVTLPTSRADFMASRSKNYRKKIGEYERRCAKLFSPVLRRARTTEDVRRDLGSLRRLHQARWGEMSRAFRSDAYNGFHTMFAVLMLEADCLRLFTLEAEGLAVASIYCLQYGSRYYYYQAGWEPSQADARVGLVLMNRVLQEAIDDGATVFDFLSGREPYKYRWATDEFKSDRLLVWRGRVVYVLSGIAWLIGQLLGIPGRLREWIDRPRL